MEITVDLIDFPGVGSRLYRCRHGRYVKSGLLPRALELHLSPYLTTYLHIVAIRLGAGKHAILLKNPVEYFKVSYQHSTNRPTASFKF